MKSTGILNIRAQLSDAGLVDLAVDLQRPAVTPLFTGQIPDAVVKAIPYLYTLCAHAQRAVAQAALAAASGEVRRPVDDAELWTEMLHEHFWRLLLDWPVALGLPSAHVAFMAWRSARQGSQVVAETEKLMDVVRSLAEQCLAQLDEGEAYAEPLSPPLAPEPWLTYWQGNVDLLPAALRPLSVGAAYRARLGELERAAAAQAAGSPYPVAAVSDKGWGVGQTLTARGVLTHAVHLHEARVLKYRIWAPTDVFFADAGALSALLAGLRPASLEAAQRLLNLAILALDPCLPYTIEVTHA